MIPSQTSSFSIDPYVEKTFGYMTNSKLKAFMACPYSYKLVFEDKIPLDRKLKKYFKLGSAFDDLISFGEEAFFKKYSILAPSQNALSENALEQAEGALYVLEDELKERSEKLNAILQENIVLESNGKKPKPITQAQKSFDSWTEKVANQKESILLIKDRMNFIELTAGEGDLLAKLQKEAMRQPAFDLGGEYESQKSFKAVFKKEINLLGTPDRVRLGQDGLIRDTKLIEDVDKADFKIFDFGYVQQLAFYQLLIELHTGLKLKCVLDFFDKKEVPRYRPMEVPQEMLDNARNEIQQGLNYYLECKKRNVFPDHSDLGLPDSKCCAYEYCTGAIKKRFEYFC